MQFPRQITTNSFQVKVVSKENRWTHKKTSKDIVGQIKSYQEQYNTSRMVAVVVDDRGGDATARFLQVVEKAIAAGSQPGSNVRVAFDCERVNP
jgi:hypothetical protein